MPSTNKTNRGKSMKDVSLNITRKIPISAGPINAAAFIFDDGEPSLERRLVG